MAKHQNKQTRKRRTRNHKKIRNRRRTYSKKGGNYYENCYIVAHGCYVQPQFIIPYNMTLAYNTPLNQPYCGNTTEIEWNPSGYPYTIDTDTTNDCFLDFVDETSHLFSSFGVYFNGQKMFEGQQNVIMSQVLNYIRTLTTKPIRVYCSICRNKCSNEDEDDYNEKIQPAMTPFQDMSPEDYAFFDDLATLGPEL